MPRCPAGTSARLPLRDKATSGYLRKFVRCNSRGSNPLPSTSQPRSAPAFRAASAVDEWVAVQAATRADRERLAADLTLRLRSPRTRLSQDDDRRASPSAAPPAPLNARAVCREVETTRHRRAVLHPIAAAAYRVGP